MAFDQLPPFIKFALLDFEPALLGFLPSLLRLVASLLGLLPLQLGLLLAIFLEPALCLLPLLNFEPPLLGFETLLLGRLLALLLEPVLLSAERFCFEPAPLGRDRFRRDESALLGRTSRPIATRDPPSRRMTEAYARPTASATSFVSSVSCRPRMSYSRKM